MLSNQTWSTAAVRNDVLGIWL